MVVLTNEYAGSDGDIFSHAFKLLKLGPLIGKRTWGGVIGISPRHSLVDGGFTTQPEFSYWFQDVGWKVENYGTDPDLEVEYLPSDYVAGRDPQLEQGLKVCLQQIKIHPSNKPHFVDFPDLRLPDVVPLGTPGGAAAPDGTSGQVSRLSRKVKARKSTSRRPSKT
jgi:tricorn protease